MQLSQRNSSKYIYAVIASNLLMVLVIYLGIQLYIESNDIADILGVIFCTIFFLALDVLYIFISKQIFAAVYIENDVLKLKSFKKYWMKLN